MSKAVVVQMPMELVKIVAWLQSRGAPDAEFVTFRGDFPGRPDLSYITKQVRWYKAGYEDLLTDADLMVRGGGAAIALLDIRRNFKMQDDGGDPFPKPLEPGRPAPPPGPTPFPAIETDPIGPQIFGFPGPGERYHVRDGAAMAYPDGYTHIDKRGSFRLEKVWQGPFLRVWWEKTGGPA